MGRSLLLPLGLLALLAGTWLASGPLAPDGGPPADGERAAGRAAGESPLADRSGDGEAVLVAATGGRAPGTPTATAAPPDQPLPAGRARLVLRVVAGEAPLPGCVVRVPGREDVQVDVGGELAGAVGVTDTDGTIRLEGPAGATIPLELAPFGVDVFERWSMTLPSAGEARTATVLVTPAGLDWFDLLVVDASTGEPIAGAQVRVRVTGEASSTFDARSGPNGVARVPAPRRGELVVSSEGFGERALVLDIAETPPMTTIGLSRTASLHGRIPAALVDDYQVIEVEYDSRGRAPVADRGLADFARPPGGGGLGGDSPSRQRFMTGRIDVTGRWSVDGLAVAAGSARVKVERIVLREESDAEALVEESGDVLLRPRAFREVRFASFACDVELGPGERAELPFPSDLQIRGRGDQRPSSERGAGR